MKAVLFSIGTRGDIEPFLAIAQILKERDWDVICVFPEQFRDIVVEMGLGFKRYSREFLEMLETQGAKNIMGSQGSILSRFKTLIKLSKTGIKLSREMIELQHKILLEEKPDRAIYHPICANNAIWGMANPDKSIMVSPIPFLLHPVKHLNVVGGSSGKFFNMLTWILANNLKPFVILKLSKHLLKNYQNMDFTFKAVKKATFENEKSLYAVSPSLFPKPDYWPSHTHVIGYHERDKTLNWKPDEALLKFLKEHEKIVFISFGSISNSNPKEKTRIIVEVLKKNNISAIINTSWGGLQEPKEPSDHIHFVSNIPYDWIFPKTYAVVHHGGSGTTHTALKYACPSLIIPHVFDQFYWNRAIAEMQLGPKGTPIKNLNERGFENLILDLLNNELYKRNAQLISKKMKIESNSDKLYKLIVS